MAVSVIMKRLDPLGRQIRQIVDLESEWKMGREPVSCLSIQGSHALKIRQLIARISSIH